jgi:SAM-dependent methyltransferase
VTDEFSNVYADAERAAAYAALEFPGTYHLAFRDLPKLIRGHVDGVRALDFGCGTGRSTRFLRRLGFETTGVDISEEMLALARARDPDGDYRLVPDGDLGILANGTFDLALAAFTFDNVPTRERKLELFRELRRVLGPGGHLVTVVSAPEIYLHEWASFSTRDHPENRKAGSGDRVRIVMLDVADRRPVEDVLFTTESYREVQTDAGFELVRSHVPLGRDDEPFDWVSETTIGPWVIDVLGKIRA